MMDDLRNNTPTKFGAWEVLEARDYKKDECIIMSTGEKKAQDFQAQMYFIMRCQIMRGAVQDRQEQNLKLSSMLALRAAALMMQMISLKS